MAWSWSLRSEMSLNPPQSNDSGACAARRRLSQTHSIMTTAWCREHNLVQFRKPRHQERGGCWRSALHMTHITYAPVCVCAACPSPKLRGEGDVYYPRPPSHQRETLCASCKKAFCIYICGCSPFPLRRSRISPFICAGFLGIIIIVCAHWVSTLTHSLPPLHSHADVYNWGIWN